MSSARSRPQLPRSDLSPISPTPNIASVARFRGVQLPTHLGKCNHGLPRARFLGPHVDRLSQLAFCSRPSSYSVSEGIRSSSEVSRGWRRSRGTRRSPLELPPRVKNARSPHGSRLSVLKNDSLGALSQQSPLRLMLCRSPCRSSRLRTHPDRRRH